MKLFKEGEHLPYYVFNQKYTKFLFLDIHRTFKNEMDLFYECFSQDLKANNEAGFYVSGDWDPELPPYFCNINERSKDNWIEYQATEYSPIEIFHSISRNPIIYGETDNWAIYYDVPIDVGVFGMTTEAWERFKKIRENIVELGWNHIDDFLDWYSKIYPGWNWMKEFDRIFRLNYTPD